MANDMIQGHPCNDKKVMANVFNNYFASIFVVKLIP